MFSNCRKSILASLAALVIMIVQGGIEGIEDTEAQPPPPPEPEHVFSGSEPANGDQTIVLREVWRTGEQDDEIFFGLVGSALADSEGNIYLLDAQLNRIVVLDADGAFLRTIGRAGDGPGEFHRPASMFFLAGKKLGVVQRLPGKIITLEQDGTPAGTIDAGGDGGSGSGGFQILIGAQLRGGTLVFCGEQNRNRTMTQYLAVVDPAGNEQTRLHSQQRNIGLQRRKYIERNEDFISRGRWTLGPDGLIYTASERDRYRIEVTRPDGQIIRIIERDYSAYLRSDADKEQFASEIVMMIDGRRVRIESELEDRDPCVQRMRVDENNCLWIANSHSGRDLPPTVFQRWDVFDPTGRFERRVHLQVPGNANDDRLIFLGSNRFLVIKGYTAAAEANRPRQGGAESGQAGNDDAEPLAVICYEIQE